jgi:hypothetical protein
MTIPDDLEQLRIYSILSEQLHYIKLDGEKYACFSGHIIPYSMVPAFLIWALTDRQVHYILYQNTNIPDIIKSLNLHDTYLVKCPSHAPQYLSNKLKNIMKTWNEDQFDNIVQQALV